MARTFIWLSTGGGTWSLGSNWNDATDHIDPSLVAPGAQDTVFVTGLSGAQIMSITGGGFAGMANFAGNTALLGNYAFGRLSLGSAGSGGLLQLGVGTNISAGSAALASGSLLAGQGGTLRVSGTLGLGTAGVAGANLTATGGATVDALALLLSNAADSIYVDPSSIVEVGNAGTGVAGKLTIDAGATLRGQGSANGFGAVANAGTVDAEGGTLTVGALSGTGTLQIGASATLALGGLCSAGQSVVFAGQNATLALKQEAFAPAGALSGFAAGDAIDVRGSAISSATYAATGAGTGILTLFYGAQVAAQFNVLGSYAGQAFLISGDGAGGTLVTVAAQAGGGGGTPSPGTPTPDQYVWIAPGSGNWNEAANWRDVTTGAAPAGIAPGKNNIVSITGGQTSFSVIAGPADAASLAVLGEVGLSGAYQLGALSIGQAAGASFSPGTLDILSGGLVAAGTCTVADGAISLSGTSTSLSVAGTLVLGGSAVLGPGLPTAALTVAAGAHVQASGLVIGGGSGAALTTDPTAWVEIGNVGGAAAGAVTVDAGSTLSGNGQVNPFGTIVDWGTILASGGGTLTLGNVSGTGSLVVSSGTTLEMKSATSLAITLSGSAASGVSTLAFATARAAPTGTISGVVVGDAFDLEGSPLTSVQFVTSNSGGTLLLIYNTSIVARLMLAGNFAADRFVQTPDGLGGTQIVVVPVAGGGGGGGQTGTDQLAWAAPVSGNWSRAANWMDVTTGQIATQPPGAHTPVQIAGPAGAVFQSITGTGTAASLTVTGNTVLSGSYATGALTVGAPGAGGSPAQAGSLVLGPGAVLTAGQATVVSGLLSTQSSGTQIDVAGTLTLGGDPQGLASTLLEAVAHSAIQLGGLSMLPGGSNAVSVDVTSWIEVGTAGGASLGALTIDAGAFASGAGTLNFGGTVIDNGLIEAAGGTLLLGAVSGAGTLGIGTEATLALSGADTCPIAFMGGGATLQLPGSAVLQAGMITGFAAGDSILTDTPVDSLAYVLGAGGTGTLVLSAGGVAAGQLLLTGNFAGNVFTATPDGAGAVIVLQPEAQGGPPAGTAAPDSYQWTGLAGDQSWAQPGNWTDLSQGPGPAAVAPGGRNAVSINGGAGLTVGGPADAASLSIAGSVSLSGLYAVGTLAIGAGGLLGLSSASSVSAFSADVEGSVAVGNGGALTIGGTLTLGANGALVASGGGTVSLQGATLDGAASMLATDGMSAIEIGGSAGAAAGSVTVDAGGLLQGAGVVGLGDQVIDQGTIAASGTLVLGPVSGGGTLLVGGGADLVLTSSASPGLTADFTGGGTLTLATSQATPAIEDFGHGSAILLSWLSPGSGTLTATYAATGAGIGLLTVAAGGQTEAQFTLLGDESGLVFTAAAAPGGGTVLSAQPDPQPPPGGITLTTYVFNSGQISRGDLLNDVAQAFPYVSQGDFGALIGEQGIYLDYNTDGLDPPQTVFGGAGQPPGVNVEIVAPLTGVVGGGAGPGALVTLTAGYSALLLEGNENVSATDSDLGHALLVGNYGSDLLFAGGDGDTLVGAPGASTTFAASLQHQNGGVSLPIDIYVHGGGNDLITTGNDNAAITTSGGAGTHFRSTVFLGASNNDVISNGADEIVCAPFGNDTILASTQSAPGGDTVFGPDHGLLTFVGGNTPSTIVGGQGQIVAHGGSAGGNLIWAAGSDVSYTGGAGSAIFVAGSGFCSVQGGSGPVTVFGGSGTGVFSGGAGSAFVAGDGPSTVNAIAGGTVFLVGSANVSVAGGNGTNVYGANSTGNNTYHAMAGNVTLWGGPGNDQFIAGSGNDIMVSAGGHDTFNYAAGTVAGRDTIVGFSTGQDTIALHGFGSGIPQLATAFGDTIINLQGGAQIIIENVTNLTAANFTLT